MELSSELALSGLASWESLCDFYLISDTLIRYCAEVFLEFFRKGLSAHLQ